MSNYLLEQQQLEQISALQSDQQNFADTSISDYLILSPSIPHLPERKKKQKKKKERNRF